MIDLVFTGGFDTALKCECRSFGQTAANILLLSLALDIGDISKSTMQRCAGRSELRDLWYLTSEEAVQQKLRNEETLRRIKNARTEGEPLRLWVGKMSPGDLCGMYYMCYFLKDAGMPLSVVYVPEELERLDCIELPRHLGEIGSEKVWKLLQTEQVISIPKREAYAVMWRQLSRENAPLRAIINGRVSGVPEDFYDFLLRANISCGEFSEAELIGRTIEQVNGIGDGWLHDRIREMVNRGELVQVANSSKYFSGYLVIREKGGQK